MTRAYFSKPKKKDYQKLQDLCGIIFIAMFALQFLFHLLILQGILDRHDAWYAYIIGFLSVTGFCMLFKLSSNTTSDIFSMSVASFELFFMIGRPFLLSSTRDDLDNNKLIFQICVFFSLFSLYMWTVLLHNCKFKKRDLPWIILLPIPFIINILGYSAYISFFANLGSVASAISDNPIVMPLLRVICSVFMPVGYWRLSHSSSFSGTSNFKFAPISFSPFNWYFLAYMLIVAALIIIPKNLFIP